MLCHDLGVPILSLMTSSLLNIKETDFIQEKLVLNICIVIYVLKSGALFYCR